MTSSVYPSSISSPFHGLDYNDAAPQFLYTAKSEDKLSVDILKQRLHNQLTAVLLHLFPMGTKRTSHFLIGNIQGEAGESLKIELSGPKIGMWHDFATNEGGDILSLWGAAKGLDPRHDFPEIISTVHEWLGTPMPLVAEQSVPSSKISHSQLFPSQSSSSQPSSGSSEDLGMPTGQWDYQDADGNLLVCVYRYDTPKGKQFRPWDVKARAYRAPNPRPLYNQPGMVNADTALLVEGEKCAKTLIDVGICHHGYEWRQCALG